MADNERLEQIKQSLEHLGPVNPTDTYILDVPTAPISGRTDRPIHLLCIVPTLQAGTHPSAPAEQR